MWWFILRPVTTELRGWWAQRAQWQSNRRSRRVAAALGLVVTLLILPLPLPITATAVLLPANTQRLYAPEAGRLEGLALRVGTQVPAGALIASIRSPAAAGEADLAQAHVDNLRAQIASAAVDVIQQERLLGLQAALQAAEADLANRMERTGRLELRAPHAGQIIDVDPDLSNGE